MAETDPSVEDDHNDYEAISEEDLRTHMRNEQSARSFFALLSFLVAIVLLAVFLNNTFDEISRLLILAAMIAFGMIGMLLLDKKHTLDHNHIPAHTIETSDRDGQDEKEVEEISAQNESDAEEIPALSPFEQLVREALDSIPEEFQKQMANLVVIVEDEPDTEVLTRSHVEENSVLLGLYSGVPLTALGSNHQMLPERITIYQHNIEMICHNDPDLIRKKVRETVLHEVAHHFGMGHEEMPIWLK
jgi:predicted Zn-dependent protease with MMP-like domain